jgi:MFS family permease
MFQITSGVVNSFMVLAFLRFCHGAVSSATKPLAYSLIADYFP